MCAGVHRKAVERERESRIIVVIQELLFEDNRVDGGGLDEK